MSWQQYAVAHYKKKKISIRGCLPQRIAGSVRYIQARDTFALLACIICTREESFDPLGLFVICLLVVAI